MSSTVHIEAFDWKFDKQKVFILGDLEDSLQIFQHIQQDLLFRGRKILVFNGNENQKAFHKMKLFQQPWDFVMKVKANIDYSILATYIQHQPRPTSILWLGSEIPNALLQKFEKDVYWICHSGSLPVSREMTYIFISPRLSPFKYKDWFLNQQPAQVQALLENLEDMREKKAGIVFSTQNKKIQWYDAGAIEENDEETSIGDVNEILKWCVEKIDMLSDSQ